MLDVASRAPELENLSEQYQHGNDGRGFEVDRNRATANRETSPGEDIRRDGADAL